MQVQENSKEGFLDLVYVSSHSHNTVDSYRNALRHFSKFICQKYQSNEDQVISEIKAGKLDVYQVLRDFVIYLDKQGYRPKSLGAWVPAVKQYLRYLGFKIYSEDCKHVVKMPRKSITREEPLTKEIIVRLLRNLPVKLQTAVLVAISSGIRIGELVQLRISDIDFESTPTRIQVRAETTKGRVGRETYLTSEATTALQDYLKRSFGWKKGEANESIKDVLIFAPAKSKKDKENSVGKKKCDPVMVAESVLHTSLKYHMSKVSGLNSYNENGRRTIHFHAFRKYFRTVVGNSVGRDFAEALMGHRFYLDTYYNLPQEKRREMYLKAEPELTISDFTKIEKDLNKIAEKQKEIEEFLSAHFLDSTKVLGERFRR